MTGLLLAAALAAQPLSEPAAGWTFAAPCRLFRGAELYGHIDGGAELYLELGFEEAAVCELGKDGATLEVELYRMTDPVAALGAYLGRCGPETPAGGLGDRHTAGRYQVLLWRERFLLVVNNPEGTPALGPAMVEVARELAGRLPPSPELEPWTALPAQGRVAGSERIVRGPVGLGAFITLGDGDVLRLGTGVTAVVARYAAGAPHGLGSLLVADYPDEAAALAALAYLGSHLDPTIEVIRRTQSGIDFRDWAGKLGTARVAGQRLELRFDLPAR
ncbi:MAG TPA: hypothetical protein P5234_00750 [Thermoanaerobaculaceae bacterium]|nr:hypothetical protein [Thermoanaerobaculaceae bacterium]HRS14757.1 hypothetical protein [Thermoanaerobaculaceae bacterium]